MNVVTIIGIIAGSSVVGSIVTAILTPLMTRWQQKGAEKRAEELHRIEMRRKELEIQQLELDNRQRANEILNKVADNYPFLKNISGFPGMSGTFNTGNPEHTQAFVIYKEDGVEIKWK